MGIAVNIKYMQKFCYDWSWWERVDTRLSVRFWYSRNFFHHIIDRWWIKVGGKLVKKSYKLKVWDEIEIDELERYISPLILDEAPNIDIPVVSEEEDYLIINKPKWVLSHPNSIRDVSKPSVVAFLYHRYKNLPSYWNFIRAWLVHRLDKDTDGLMIIAKTEVWLQYFKMLFQDKSESLSLEEKELVPLQKFYRATCEITQLWEDFLLKMEQLWLPYYIQELVVAKVPNTIPKVWITKVLDFSLYEDDKLVNLNLQILTWRTHQIRYHLSNHWLPILWDYLYWNEDDVIPMQLTAYKLEFMDPYGKKIKVEI